MRLITNAEWAALEAWRAEKRKSDGAARRKAYADATTRRADDCELLAGAIMDADGDVSQVGTASVVILSQRVTIKLAQVLLSGVDGVDAMEYMFEVPKPLRADPRAYAVAALRAVATFQRARAVQHLSHEDMILAELEAVRCTP
jgi:hypothetical protein